RAAVQLDRNRGGVAEVVPTGLPEEAAGGAVGVAGGETDTATADQPDRVRQCEGLPESEIVEPARRRGPAAAGRDGAEGENADTATEDQPDRVSQCEGLLESEIVEPSRRRAPASEGRDGAVGEIDETEAAGDAEIGF